MSKSFFLAEKVVIERDGGNQMLESGIVAHCAPTLAGIKTANMFNYLSG